MKMRSVNFWRICWKLDNMERSARVETIPGRILFIKDLEINHGKNHR
jgi:hypothetical protein